jgi:hypothetical protein
MTATTRRGLLGMFAAGAAAAILPSGILMPVRPRIWTPPALPPAGVERRFIGVDYGSGDCFAVTTWWEQRGDQLVFLERTITRDEAYLP